MNGPGPHNRHRLFMTDMYILGYSGDRTFFNPAQVQKCSVTYRCTQVYTKFITTLIPATALHFFLTFLLNLGGHELGQIYYSSLAPDVSPMLGVLQFKLRKLELQNAKHWTNVWCETAITLFIGTCGILQQTHD